MAIKPFMGELARRTPSTLRDFMDRVDEFANADDTLWALVGSHLEAKRNERKGG